jgi:hypothetical protein
MRCKECGKDMRRTLDGVGAKGSWATYTCTNRDCASVKRGYPAKEKVFESSK